MLPKSLKGLPEGHANEKPAPHGFCLRPEAHSTFIHPLPCFIPQRLLGLWLLAGLNIVISWARGVSPMELVGEESEPRQTGPGHPWSMRG